MFLYSIPAIACAPYTVPACILHCSAMCWIFFRAPLHNRQLGSRQLEYTSPSMDLTLLGWGHLKDLFVDLLVKPCRAGLWVETFMHYKEFSCLNINEISVLIPAGYLMTSRLYILIAQILFLPVSMLLSVCLIWRHLTVADLLVSSSQLLLFCGTSRYLYAEQQSITSVCPHLTVACVIALELASCIIFYTPSTLLFQPPSLIYMCLCITLYEIISYY